MENRQHREDGPPARLSFKDVQPTRRIASRCAACRISACLSACLTDTEAQQPPQYARSCFPPPYRVSHSRQLRARRSAAARGPRLWSALSQTSTQSYSHMRRTSAAPGAARPCASRSSHPTKSSAPTRATADASLFAQTTKMDSCASQPITPPANTRQKRRVSARSAHQSTDRDMFDSKATSDRRLPPPVSL